MAKPKETNKKKKTVVRSPKPTKISFEYLKSAYHRVVLVTGATGGPTPNAKLICMTTFNERLPIQKREEYELSDGKIGALKKSTARDAIVRECEVTLMFDVSTARSIRDWLAMNIQKIEDHTGTK
ncbi:MAG: hypothetical protein IH987_06435 [Planctomycetes bacterium]|nr:hypothetical protein [Planctomycetota bacterium]